MKMIADIMYSIWAGVWVAVYTVWTGVAKAVDILEDMFLLLAGVKPPDGIKELPVEVKHITAPAESDYSNIVSWVIRQNAIQQVFKNLVIVAVILLMFFTILKIIQEQYKDKGGKMPPTVFICILNFYFTSNSPTNILSPFTLSRIVTDCLFCSLVPYFVKKSS